MSLPQIGVRVAKDRYSEGHFYCILCNKEIPIQNALLVVWHQIRRDLAKRRRRELDVGVNIIHGQRLGGRS
jgi:hypothetical protein